MTLYALNRAIFDHLRRLEDPAVETAPGPVSTQGYALSDAEAAAAASGDVAGFHTLGVHPVLINAYCRANGWKRDDYRVLFPTGSDAAGYTARWTGFGANLGADGLVRLGGDA